MRKTLFPFRSRSPDFPKMAILPFFPNPATLIIMRPPSFSCAGVKLFHFLPILLPSFRLKFIGRKSRGLWKTDRGGEGEMSLRRVGTGTAGRTRGIGSALEKETGCFRKRGRETTAARRTPDRNLKGKRGTVCRFFPEPPFFSKGRNEKRKPADAGNG